MKNFLIRSHNVKAKNLPTWPTPHDKTPETIIYDEKNGYAFCIRFGPNPEILVFNNSDQNNLGDEIHNFKVGEAEDAQKTFENVFNKFSVEFFDNWPFGVNCKLTKK